MTNNHCISEQDGSKFDVNNSELWFNYQKSSCNSGSTASITIVKADKLLKTDSSLDYTLFTIKESHKVAKFGYLGLDNTDTPVGENIYLSGHPAGAKK